MPCVANYYSEPLILISGENQDAQKLQYIDNLGPGEVVAIGNGNNDRKMLAASRIGIAVCLDECVSSDALKAATLVVKSPIAALPQ